MYNRRPSRPYDPNTRREYSHSPTQSQLDDETKISISERGRVVITQGDVAKDEYDEVDLSAAQVYRIAALLNETKSVKYVTKDVVK